MISSELQFILQLGILIVFTRLGGHWLRRWLNLPGVLGELIVGMIIGPYALGHIEWPVIGALFPVATTGHAVSSELYALATFASIILLFLSGLETDLSTFLRYSVAGTLVGIGGVIVSFYLGAGCARLVQHCRWVAGPQGALPGRDGNGHIRRHQRPYSRGAPQVGLARRRYHSGRGGV